MIAFRDVAVRVRDAKASAKWWSERCGFDVRDNSGHWVTVAAPGSPVLIHLCEGDEAEKGNTGIAWRVGDLAATEKAWAAKGVQFTSPTNTDAWGTWAMFTDPDGNEFWLFEDKSLRAKAA